MIDLTTPPTRKFVGGKEQAEAEAGTIVALGGLAWIEAEYGDEMGHLNVFQGYRVMYFSPETVKRAATGK